MTTQFLQPLKTHQLSRLLDQTSDEPSPPRKWLRVLFSRKSPLAKMLLELLTFSPHRLHFRLCIRSTRDEGRLALNRTIKQEAERIENPLQGVTCVPAVHVAKARCNIRKNASAKGTRSPFATTCNATSLMLIGPYVNPRMPRSRQKLDISSALLISGLGRSVS